MGLPPQTLSKTPRRAGLVISLIEIPPACDCFYLKFFTHALRNISPFALFRLFLRGTFIAVGENHFPCRFYRGQGMPPSESTFFQFLLALKRVTSPGNCSDSFGFDWV